MTVTCISGPTNGLYSVPFHIQLFLLIIGKGKVVPVHTMKAYSQSRHIAGLILNIGTGWSLTSHSGCRTPLSRRVGGSRSQSGHFGGEKSHAAIGIQIPVHPACNLVAILAAF